MISIKKCIKFLGNILTLLSVIFLIMAMIKLDIDFSQIQNMSCLVAISIIGSIIIMLTVYMMAYAWRIILENLSEKKLSGLSTIKVYAKANMGKYLPGNVMHYVERNLFAADMGLEQLEIAASSIIEIGAQVFAAILLSLILSHKQFIKVLQQTVSYKMVAIIIPVILFVILMIYLYIRHSKNDRLIKLIFRRQFVCVIGQIMPLYAMASLFSGAVMLFVCKYVLVCEMTVEKSLFVIMTFVLAWLFGFIVPGAPGGIGVREFVLVLLLSATIGEANILLAALIHRMICILGDILAYVVTIPMEMRGRKI